MYIKWTIIQPYKENSDTRYNINEPLGYYVKWNKPVTGRQTLYNLPI